MKKKQSKIRKRYIFLICIALLPLFKLIHPNDYCFGVADLLLIAAIGVVFFIAFMVILFYNLYKVSLKRELFNIRPVLILVVFGISLFLGLKYHDKNIFKTVKKKYVAKENGLFNNELTLFTDKTFELKNIKTEYSCYIKGNYHKKGNTLHFSDFDTSSNFLEKEYLVIGDTLVSENSQKAKFILFENSQ